MESNAHLVGKLLYGPDYYNNVEAQMLEFATANGYKLEKLYRYRLETGLQSIKPTIPTNPIIGISMKRGGINSEYANIFALHLMTPEEYSEYLTTQHESDDRVLSWLSVCELVPIVDEVDE